MDAKDNRLRFIAEKILYLQVVDPFWKTLKRRTEIVFIIQFYYQYRRFPIL